MQALRPAGGMARADRCRQASCLRKRGLLGPRRARLRRPGRGSGARGPGACCPWGEPHRADVHRRPLGRLPVFGAASLRLCQPAHLGALRRRPGTPRCVHHRGGALRAAGQQAHACGAGRLPPVPRTRANAAGQRPRGRRSRCVRLRRALHPRRHTAAAEVRPRRHRGCAPRGGACCADAARRHLPHRLLVPSQSAEHVHRPPHPPTCSTPCCAMHAAS